MCCFKHHHIFSAILPSCQSKTGGCLLSISNVSIAIIERSYWSSTLADNLVFISFTIGCSVCRFVMSFVMRYTPQLLDSYFLAMILWKPPQSIPLTDQLELDVKKFLRLLLTSKTESSLDDLMTHYNEAIHLWKMMLLIDCFIFNGFHPCIRGSRLLGQGISCFWDFCMNIQLFMF